MGLFGGLFGGGNKKSKTRVIPLNRPPRVERMWQEWMNMVFGQDWNQEGEPRQTIFDRMAEITQPASETINEIVQSLLNEQATNNLAQDYDRYSQEYDQLAKEISKQLTPIKLKFGGRQIGTLLPGAMAKSRLLQRQADITKNKARYITTQETNRLNRMQLAAGLIDQMVKYGLLPQSTKFDVINQMIQSQEPLRYRGGTTYTRGGQPPSLADIASGVGSIGQIGSTLWDWGKAVAPVIKPLIVGASMAAGPEAAMAAPAIDAFINL